MRIRLELKMKQYQQMVKANNSASASSSADSARDKKTKDGDDGDDGRDVALSMHLQWFCRSCPMHA